MMITTTTTTTSKGRCRHMSVNNPQCLLKALRN
jgi:hypothetical protein